MSVDELDDLAIQNFRDYLRIPSVHPEPDCSGCVEFARKQASELGLIFNVYEFVKNRPIVILTWPGLDANLPSILLIGHMDVVTVDESCWRHPPFEAHMDEKTGDIFGRGAQDMKSVNVQYLEAIRRLKLEGCRLRRTIHVSFMPDEETGGFQGMRVFVKTAEFQKLNAGFALDEGITSTGSDFKIFYGERCTWQIWVSCKGPAGHGSSLHEGTAGEKLGKVIQKFMSYRDQEKKKLEDPKIRIGDVTSINLTQVEGGHLPNVVPNEMKACFDIRLDNNKDHATFERMLRQWCKEVGEGVTFEFLYKNEKYDTTPLTDDNTYWKTFESVAKRLGLELEPVICPGCTDVRYVRSVGVPGIGFSPINNTGYLLHNHNEYLNKDVFLKGITVYKEVITALGNLAP